MKKNKPGLHYMLVIVLTGVLILSFTNKLRAFDPYSAAAVTSANSTTTTSASSLTGYTTSNTTSSYANSVGNGSLGNLQAQGMVSLSNPASSTVSGVFNTSLNNYYIMTPQAGFLASSIGMATNPSLASGYLTSVGTHLLPAASNTTQFSVTSGGGTTTTVCDKTSTSTANTTCNILKSYTYPSCNVTNGTITPIACVAGSGGSTPNQYLLWVPGTSGPIYVTLSIPPQCPSWNYFQGAYTDNIGSNWAFYVRRDSYSTSPVTLFNSYYYNTSNPGIKTYFKITYTGGCSPSQMYLTNKTSSAPLIASCSYYFQVSINSGAPSGFGSISFNYQPEQAYAQYTTTDTCVSLAANSLCHLSNTVCTLSGTRYVNTDSFSAPTPGGCWNYQKTYSCLTATDKTACTNLLSQGYIQVSSGICVNTDPDGNCLSMKYSMQLTTTACVASHTITATTQTIQGGCASGNTMNCIPPPPAPTDPSMAQAVTQLMAAHATAADFSTATNPPAFFNGQALGCGYDALLGTYNCCSNSTSLINPSCNSTEKLLAQDRQNNECTFVGTSCSAGYDPCQPLGSCYICTQNSDTYCCFSSELADLIQNGAHSQLGIPWVTGALPGGANCGPLTATQITSLDFSKIDFSPLFGQVNANLNSAQTFIQQQLSSQTGGTLTCPSCP